VVVCDPTADPGSAFRLQPDKFPPRLQCACGKLSAHRIPISRFAEIEHN
jgi:hypothetical protein